MSQHRDGVMMPAARFYICFIMIIFCSPIFSINNFDTGDRRPIFQQISLTILLKMTSSSKMELLQSFTNICFKSHNNTIFLWFFCIVLLQSLDGFAFSLSNDGRFLYISETVSIYLGLSQVSHGCEDIFMHAAGHVYVCHSIVECNFDIWPTLPKCNVISSA